jgi:hypothetical protein
VKKHPFFSSIDFDLLEKRQIDPPFKPKVRSETDTTQIDPQFTSEKPQDSLVENTLGDVKENFNGFTYVAPSQIQ